MGVRNLLPRYSSSYLRVSRMFAIPLQSLSVYNLLLDLLSLTHRNQTGRYQASHMNIIRTYISSRALTFQTSCFYLIQWKDFKNDEKRLFHVQNSFRSQNI